MPLSMLILKHMLNQSAALDRAFHALSDPTRRALLDQLTRGPATVSDLARPFNSTLASIVQHIQVLEGSGLIVTAKVGRTRTCRVSSDAFARVEDWLSERRRIWEGRFDRLGALLETSEMPVPAPLVTELPPLEPATPRRPHPPQHLLRTPGDRDE
jgi:DNA-binding transcriptional ArsR family regulator